VRETELSRPAKTAFPPNWPARAVLVALLAYVVYATATLEMSLMRLVEGLGHGRRFLSRMFPPTLASDKLLLLQQGMLESLQIAVLATAFGIAPSFPLGLAAARNLSPAPLAWTARALIALLRSLHPVILAILFVKAFGLGPLAGVLALGVTSIAYLSKLLAEAVEEIEMKQVEAIRATGASFLSVIIMSVLPQVLPRFTGFCAYQLDSNLRNSALVGLVGGGGIGATLFTAFQRFDYDFVLTIVLAVIALVMLGEFVSGYIRTLFQ
jgi:phosphonate ABC transporter permease subunit PhnE